MGRRASCTQADLSQWQYYPASPVFICTLKVIVPMAKRKIPTVIITPSPSSKQKSKDGSRKPNLKVRLADYLSDGGGTWSWGPLTEATGWEVGCCIRGCASTGEPVALPGSRRLQGAGENQAEKMKCLGRWEENLSVACCHHAVLVTSSSWPAGHSSAPLAVGCLWLERG